MLGTDICNKTIGLIGFGKIGQSIAKRAIGFDMKIM
jgi:glyoxylate reductase